MSATAPSSTDTITIFIDGASLGNPGPAGLGAVFVDGEGRTRLQLYKYLGETTNNVAEYLALVYALHEAGLRGWVRVAVKTDSELLERQMNGQYKVRDATLRLLYDLARTFRLACEVCTIDHIPRERNTRADGLAAEAVKIRREHSLVIVPA